MPAIVISVVASQNTLWTSFLAVTVMIAAPISSPERIRKATTSTSTVVPPPPDDSRPRPFASPKPPQAAGQRGEQDRQKGEGKELFPSDVEDLVDADARHRPADPHEDDEDGIDLDGEPELLRQDRDRIRHARRREVGDEDFAEQRARPAAKEQDCDERGPRDRAEPLEAEHDAEAHPAVFRRPPLDELRLRLGDVERDALRLGDDRDEEDDECDPQHGVEYVPIREPGDLEARGLPES